MAVKRNRTRQPTGEFTLKIRDFRGRWSDRIVAAFAFLIPLVVVMPAKDTFRTAKDALFRGEAILLVALYVAAAMVRPPRDVAINWRQPAVILPFLIVAWTAITTIFSSNPSRSLDGLVTVCASTVVFFATVGFAKRRGFKTLFFILVPAVINAIVGALQEFDVWQPFQTPANITHHQRSSALIGNPNDAGGYLAAAALAALAGSIVSREYRRAVVIAAVALIAGLFVNQTLTAIIAFAIAALVMAAMRSKTKAIAAAVVGLAAIALVFALFGPWQRRVRNMRGWVRTGNYNALFTNRGAPFITAALMARDHPFLGVGPSCFAFEYFPYKFEAEKRVPSLRSSYTRGTNYGEVHNDHLQVLAETGVPGYALFLAVIAALASMSLSHQTAVPSERRDFTRMLAFPLAAELFVLTLAQFPLELTAVLSELIFLAALCTAWVDG